MHGLLQVFPHNGHLEAILCPKDSSLTLLTGAAPSHLDRDMRISC